MALNGTDVIGRLVHSPEMKYTKDKKIPYISFQIVVNDWDPIKKMKDDVFIKCMAWTSTAKNIIALNGPSQRANFLGKLKNRVNNTQEGKVYKELYFLVDKVIYIEDRGKNKDYYYEGVPTAHEKAAEKESEKGTDDYIPKLDVTEDDLPF